MLGIGDDAAALKTKADQALLVSTDTLVAGVHFKPNDPPQDIGHKALAVNLSDLAAMGTKPQWVTLNLTLPKIDHNWIDNFISGFSSLLKRHQVALIGGDTTQGQLSITVTVFGQAKTAQIKSRKTAKNGDLIAVTGTLGGAAFALQNPGVDATCDRLLNRPIPRIDMIKPLQNIAHAMIDISDGLLADLQHICHQSKLGAIINCEQLPMPKALSEQADAYHYALTGGDDYQLCFTFAESQKQQLPADCHIIGKIKPAAGIEVLLKGQEYNIKSTGFNHFLPNKPL